MRRVPMAALGAALVLGLAATPAVGATKAELVSARVIWDRAPHAVATDLARSKDRWVVVFRESTDESTDDGAARVLTSADGVKWEAGPLIKSPTPERGLGQPRLTVAPDGRVTLTAPGIVVNPDAAEPLPRFGGTIKTMAWGSQDGRAWGDVEYPFPKDYPLGGLTWHKGVAYGQATGCICGSMQTVRLFAGKGGKGFVDTAEKTFSGFFPGDASVFFNGDVAHSLMVRRSAGAGNPLQSGYLGTARAPYDDWEWKELDERITHPKVVRLPDGRVLASVGLSGGKARTSLCELDLAAGKLKELLELPTGGRAVGVGLAHHDGHLWITYHARHNGKYAVHLAKVKVK